MLARTTADYLAFLRSYRFRPWCPLCKGFRRDCRVFSHFGYRGWDFENELPRFEEQP